VSLYCQWHGWACIIVSRLFVFVMVSAAMLEPIRAHIPQELTRCSITTEQRIAI